MSATGGSANTKLGDIDRNQLLAAVQKHEGAGMTDSPVVSSYLKGGSKAQPSTPAELVQKIRSSANPAAIVEKMSAQQAEQVLADASASQLPQGVLDRMLALVPIATANAFADRANLEELKAPIAANDPKKVAAVITELVQNKTPTAKILELLNAAGLSSGGNYNPFSSNLSEQIAESLGSDKAFKEIVSALE